MSKEGTKNKNLAEDWKKKGEKRLSTETLKRGNKHLHNQKKKKEKKVQRALCGTYR